MPYSPRNVKIACNHAGLRHYGGVYFFHEFLRVLQFRNFLATHLTYSRRKNRYHLSQMILALMYPIVLGLDRLETASFLLSNGTFQYLTGLPSFPDPQTLRRFLHHAPDAFWQQMHRVNDRLAGNFDPLARSALQIDLRFGQHRGYGIRKSGRCCRRLPSPLSWQEILRPTALYLKRIHLTSGMPNSAPETPAPGMAARKCWTPASPMFHPRFASCESAPTPASASIQSSSLWKRGPHNMRFNRRLISCNWTYRISRM